MGSEAGSAVVRAERAVAETRCPEDAPSSDKGHYPDSAKLASVLSSVLCEDGHAHESIEIVARNANRHESSYPSEMVRCSLRSGDRHRYMWVFCKYGTPSGYQRSFGHRGDTSYEARVYRELLGPSNASAPRLYGTHSEGPGRTWLFMEYMEDGVRGLLPKLVVRGGRWIGEFQRQFDQRRNLPSFLKRYDRRYYLGWSTRALRKVTGQTDELDWFPSLCEAFDSHVSELTAGTKTVIHGEYYGINILHQKGTVRPVDWQSAAVAKGEIDLASLTQAWPRNVVTRAEEEYCLGRWGGSPPGDFRRILDLARIYLWLRWLGDPYQHKVSPRKKKFMKELLEEGKRLKFI